MPLENYKDWQQNAGEYTKVVLEVRYIFNIPVSQGTFPGGGYDDLHEKFKSMTPSQIAVAMLEYDLEQEEIYNVVDAAESEEVINVRALW